MAIRKLKITEQQLKQYLLEHYVDSSGRKVSDRVLLSSEEFMNYTGLYQIDFKTKIRKPCSLGNISYWKKKLGLMEYDVYVYHRDVTNRISKECDFEVWSNKAEKKENKISKRKTKKRNKERVVYNPNIEKDLIISLCGFPKHFENYTLTQVKDLACELWDDMGKDSTEELLKIQKNMFQIIKREELKKQNNVVKNKTYNLKKYNEMRKREAKKKAKMKAGV